MNSRLSSNTAYQRSDAVISDNSDKLWSFAPKSYMRRSPCVKYKNYLKQVSICKYACIAISCVQNKLFNAGINEGRKPAAQYIMQCISVLLGYRKSSQVTSTNLTNAGLLDIIPRNKVRYKNLIKYCSHLCHAFNAFFSASRAVAVEKRGWPLALNICLFYE